jgi:hypothetical protein
MSATTHTPSRVVALPYRSSRTAHLARRCEMRPQPGLARRRILAAEPPTPHDLLDDLKALVDAGLIVVIDDGEHIRYAVADDVEAGVELPDNVRAIRPETDL